MQKFITRFYHALLATESFLLMFFLLTAIIIACSQIFLRNLFDTGIFWADSALRVLVLWIGMIGAMFASRQKKHIRIDLLSHYLPPLLKQNIDRLTDFVTAFICAVVAYYSVEFIQYEYADGQVAFANVPIWLTEVIIPFAFTVMALRYFIFSLFPMVVPEEEDESPPSELV